MNKIRLAFQNLAPFRWHFAAVGVAILLGVLVGTLTLTTKVQSVDTADHWTFPKWAPYTAGPKREIAHLLTWVDDPTKKKDVAVKVAGPPWRFIGTVQDGKKNVAVIELDQGKRVQRMASGELLPSGAQILKVGVGELVYSQDGEEKILKLFALEKPAGLLPAQKK